MILLLICLGILMAVSAVAALYVKQLESAIIITGVVSLTASIVFLLLGAPDVAMTEAAIGSALTTVIFLFSLARMRDTEARSDHSGEEE